MEVALQESQCETQTARLPLLMEQPVNHNGHEHVINITRGDVSSTSISHGDDHTDSDEMHYENWPSTSTQAPISQSSLSTPIASNSRNVSFRRRDDNHSQHHRSPLNSGLWISIELLVNVSQIIAAIIVVSLSRHEHPRAPLFAWVIGYTAGCIATLPHLYWRYIHHNSQRSEQESAHSRQSSFQNNSSESRPDSEISFTQPSEREDRHRASVLSLFGPNLVVASPRLNALVDHFKMALDCFFVVWIVVGNVWIFGGHSSVANSPNLYRLCIVFLTFSCIGYAMPFILCATICCCLPCIISILGIREDLSHNRGATTESINTLPTYKFKSKINRNQQADEISSEGLGEGGILAAGTDKERIISAEDAVCCICLARYVDNDELRELLCTHFFHTECVDKWLKINALCPLCKSEVGDAAGSSLFTSNSGRHHNDRRVGSGADTRGDTV